MPKSSGDMCSSKGYMMFRNVLMIVTAVAVVVTMILAAVLVHRSGETDHIAPAAFTSSSSAKPSASSFTVYEVDEFSCNSPPSCVRTGAIQTYVKSATYSTPEDAIINDATRSLSNATGYCVTASQEASPSTFFYQDCTQQYNFFGRGSISVVGEYREDLNYMIYRPETWIIVGGTGDFAGARGYVNIPPIASEGYYTVKFYLL